ncbi:MAG: PAS domain-containing protein, partial [Candidatus Binatia bacterium]
MKKTKRAISSSKTRLSPLAVKSAKKSVLKPSQDQSLESAALQNREKLQQSHDQMEIRVREGNAEINRLGDALQAEINERTWAQEQFQVAVESAPNGILIIDQIGNIGLVNAHIEQLFGFTRNE